MRREVKQLQNLQQQSLNHSVIKYKKDYYKIENSEFIKAKRVKYSVSKELIFNDFDKPITYNKYTYNNNRKWALEVNGTNSTLLLAIKLQ